MDFGGLKWTKKSVGFYGEANLPEDWPNLDNRSYITAPIIYNNEDPDEIKKIIVVDMKHFDTIRNIFCISTFHERMIREIYFRLNPMGYDFQYIY